MYSATGGSRPDSTTFLMICSNEKRPLKLNNSDLTVSRWHSSSDLTTNKQCSWLTYLVCLAAHACSQHIGLTTGTTRSQNACQDAHFERNMYNARHKTDGDKQRHHRCMTWLTLEAQRRSACSLRSFKSLPAMPGEACATVASSASDRCLAYWCRICALQVSSGSPNCTDVLNLHETDALTVTTNCTL